MSAEYVRGYYGVDFKVGERMRFDYDSRVGTLVSFPNQYLGIRFDGESRTSRVHPLEARRLSDGTTGREVTP